MGSQFLLPLHPIALPYILFGAHGEERTNGRKQRATATMIIKTAWALIVFRSQAKPSQTVSHLILKIIPWGRNCCPFVLVKEAERLDNLPEAPGLTAGGTRIWTQSACGLLTSGSAVLGVKSACRSHTAWKGGSHAMIPVVRPPGSARG